MDKYILLNAFHDIPSETAMYVVVRICTCVVLLKIEVKPLIYGHCFGQLPAF